MAIITGTSGNDRIAPDAEDPALRPTEGDDEIHGLAGDDWIDAGEGADIIHAGDGNDTILHEGDWGDAPGTIDGGAGYDTLQIRRHGEYQTWSVGGIEELLVPCSAAASFATAQLNSFQHITPAAGSSGGLDLRVIGGGLLDLSSSLSPDFAQVSIAGGAQDRLEIRLPENFSADLTLDGSQWAGLTITAGSGNDRIIGSAGSDIIHGGDGDDSIESHDRKNDQLSGGEGNDRISAETGRLDGGGGDDQLFLKVGNTAQNIGLIEAHGGDGDDVITVSAISRLKSPIDGGAGHDRVIIESWDMLRKLPSVPMKNIEELELSARTAIVTPGQIGKFALLSSAGNPGELVALGIKGGGTVDLAGRIAENVEAISIEAITKGKLTASVGQDYAGQAYFYDHRGGASTFTGGAGSDGFFGNRGADRMSGGAGDDFFLLGPGDASRKGKAAVTHPLGAEIGPSAQLTVSLKGKLQYHDVIDGGAGIDLLAGTSGADAILLDGMNAAVAGKDRGIARLDGIELFDLAAGDDVLVLLSPTTTYTTAVAVGGGGGDDVIWSGSGDDLLEGGDGADVLMGGIGDDWLTGGAGADRFQIVNGTGTDTIMDLEQGGDRLVLIDFGLTSLTGLDITRSGSDTLLAVAGNGTPFAILQGFTGTLTADDVIFVG